jgi:hypothetical protein
MRSTYLRQPPGSGRIAKPIFVSSHILLVRRIAACLPGDMGRSHGKSAGTSIASAVWMR